MLTFRVARKAGKVVSAMVIHQNSPKKWEDGSENRNDWSTYEAAAEVAAALGPLYQAIDNGQYMSPRYDVIDLPQIGQEVSYAFNGDSYPCGKIVSISAGPGFRRIVAEDANGKYVFNRRCRDGKPTEGAWIKNGVWSMVQGHINKTNPEF